VGDFLHGQKRIKPLSKQIAFCQAMAVGFKLYQIPLVHSVIYQTNRSLLDECNRIKTHGKLAKGHAGIPNLSLA